MNYVKDFIYVSKHSFTKTFDVFGKNYMLIFTGIVYSVISMLASYLISLAMLGPFSILSGILLYLLKNLLSCI